eukprot:TRINITY_DN41997_c0_g1_i1.p1 TRINITY_DN41997_c0_g1~~TRINITY_DN41997_c0_g1_i1.p1  ORF type:complete len:409 (-),score=31.28 TRINITY_DN41997_c0_g1_i1:63-1289(-)
MTTYQGLIWPILVVFFGSVDRIVGQIQAQTLGQYNFLKGALNCVMYFVVYFLILFLRYSIGIVAKRQVHFMYACTLNPPVTNISSRCPSLWQKCGAWKFLLIAGASDCVNELLSFASQPFVKGIVYNLMSQGTIVFITLFSLILLRTRYTGLQVMGLLIAISGAIIGGLGSNWETSEPFYVVLLVLSAVPSGLSFVLKEKTFRYFDAWMDSIDESGSFDALSEARQTSSVARSRERLDVFVVCSATGLFSLLSGPLLLPLASEAGNKENLPLAEWWADAWTCFTNNRPERLLPKMIEHSPHICTDAWELYLLYATINAFFNISIYFSILNSSSTFTFLSMKLLTPISSFLFLVKWPLIGQGTISWLQVAAVVAILSGVFLFQFGKSAQVPPATSVVSVALSDTSAMRT